MLLKYANFTVVRKEKEIVISRGLIEKQQITIPLQRIQAIKIKESLIRRPFGLAAVTIVSAGGNVLEEDKSAILFPIISKKIINQRLGEFIPDYAPEDDLNRLPKRAAQPLYPARILAGSRRRSAFHSVSAMGLFVRCIDSFLLDHRLFLIPRCRMEDQRRQNHHVIALHRQNNRCHSTQAHAGFRSQPLVFPAQKTACFDSYINKIVCFNGEVFGG